MLAEYELKRESDERLFILNNDDGHCPLHFHRKIELTYVLCGHKEVLLSDKTVVLQKDQIFVADSYLMHGYNKSEDSKQIVLVIPNHVLKDYYALYSGKTLKDNFVFDEEKAIKLKPYFEAIAKRPNALLMRANINMILGNLVDILGVEDREKLCSPTFIEDVLAYINDNFKEEISLDTLANHFGYSKYYFSRMFNSILHSNLTNYLTIIRLQNAIDMLKAGNTTVSDAAFESGFASIATFYRAMKKNYKYKTIKDVIENGRNSE